MLKNSDSNSRTNEIRQNNLTIMYCYFIFEALEQTFGTEIAKRYVESDSEFSSEMQEIICSEENASYRELKGLRREFPALAFESSDLFREAYNRIFPRTVRHAQGEYYTPLWLAEHVLEQVQYCQTGFQTLLDPCCGSGVFLLQGLNQIVHYAQQNKITITAKLFMNNLFGCDINPVSVFACKANLRINVFRLTGIVLPDELNNICCVDFLDRNKIATESKTYNNAQLDVIVGNPPWISWDNLDLNYRHQLDFLWKYYNLFHLTGTAVRYGGSKKDLSELFFYKACTQLKTSGRISFILPQSLLFNVASGGFRRWELPDKTPLKIELVEDYSQLNIFGTYAAKACCVYAQKGNDNQYPIRYIKVHHENSNKCTEINVIKFSQLSTIERQANLSDASDKLSTWTVEDKNNSCQLIHHNKNFSDYTAHLGGNSGGANGVFWLQIVDNIDEGHVMIRNLSQCSKKEVPTVEMEIESALLYPLARWKSIDRGVIKLDNAVILVVQDPVTRTGLNRDIMERMYPQTLGYLSHFENLLSNRAAQKRYQSRGEFYSMYNVGQYTFSDWKCVWRRMDNRIRAVAIGPQSVSGLPRRPVFPQETCVFIPAQSEMEAYYLSGMMNSSLVNRIACSSSNVGGKGFGSPCLLTRIPLPKFDEQNSIHLELSNLEKQFGYFQFRESIQLQIDSLVTKLLFESTN